MIKTIETEQGLLPKEELAPLGDFVVEREARRIIIRPKRMTEATRGLVGNGDSEATDRLIRPAPRQNQKETYESTCR